MNTWLRIATSTAAGPVCIAVTVIGLCLSYLAWRRKGARSGLRGIAWSLLPAVAWLTNSVHLIGQIGSAVVQFAQSFAFSPKTWLGVVLVVLAAVLFLVSGGIPMLQRGGRRKKKEGRDGRTAELAEEHKTAGLPAKRGKDQSADEGAVGDDVEAILRKHGIS
jgi:hypothetical protein